MQKPTIAVTMGDPTGIGPESIAVAWNDPRIHEIARPLVIGHADVLRQACEVDIRCSGISVTEVDRDADFATLDFPTDTIPVVNVADVNVVDIPRNRNGAIGGQAAYDCLVFGAKLALEHRVDAIVTAPLSKTALHMAGHDYPGHTELLGELCGVDKVAMLLYLANDGNMVRGRWGLGVAHVTLHMAMRDVFDNINEQSIVATARLLHDFFIRVAQNDTAGTTSSQFSDSSAPPVPRLAVASLNCHGGEAGLFGDEELKVIGPAVELCRQQGMNATGPIPCDTLMKRAAEGEFDGVVAMYHDQGHIALKLIGMHSAVNVTLGLPIVRTSVAHGTAFDIAWQGKVNPNSMVEAMFVAGKLVGR